MSCFMIIITECKPHDLPGAPLDCAHRASQMRARMSLSEVHVQSTSTRVSAYSVSSTEVLSREIATPRQHLYPECATGKRTRLNDKL